MSVEEQRAIGAKLEEGGAALAILEDELLKTMSGEEISATQNAGSSLAIAKNENTSISTSLKIKKITGS